MTTEPVRFDRSWASYALDAVGRGIQWFVKRVVLGGLHRPTTCHLCDEQGTYYTQSGNKECACSGKP